MEKRRGGKGRGSSHFHIRIFFAACKINSQLHKLPPNTLHILFLPAADPIQPLLPVSKPGSVTSSFLWT
jgi:hypothetical protein